MSSQQKGDPHACRVSRKHVHVREMLATSRVAVFFQVFVLPDVRKVASLKRRVRSTFSSQNAQNTSGREPFLKLRSAKMAGRCGAKHICKSKCTKHLREGAIFEVAIRENGTPLWREAHLSVKTHKTPHARATFGS